MRLMYTNTHTIKGGNNDSVISKKSASGTDNYTFNCGCRGMIIFTGILFSFDNEFHLVEVDIAVCSVGNEYKILFTIGIIYREYIVFFYRFFFLFCRIIIHKFIAIGFD